ncbi:leucine-rich repeat domain-containing protein, partial [Algibacter sp.]|uniref:leucine-rich repeat domain-containing protein n=1 Tax=Algibacter sp. TaxID=1872428 RepID=UPI003C7159E5
LMSPLSLAQNPVPTVEYQALVDFYNLMGGDDWLTKWDISSNNLHTTTWHGVVVENEHIVEINLPNNRIKGAIPSSFGNLKSLRKLNLGSTTTSTYYAHDLSSTNLNNLSGLESLEDLNLRYCNIAGSIPASWSQLTNLKFLVVSNNALTGTIFNEIGNLTALESVDLSYNGLDAIPATIANLTNLKTLNLQNNKLKKLPQVMESLTSLTSLNLYYNEISEIEALLSTSVALYLNYQTITLGEFVFTGDDVLVTNLPNITRYNRSQNDFSALNSFYLRIDGANIVTGLQLNADGSLLIEKQYLSSLTPEKQVALYQQNGNASGSYLNFTTTTVSLPEVPETEYQALVDFYNATQGDSSWLTTWDVSTNNLNIGPWFGLVIEDGHIVEIDLTNNRIRGAIPASFSDLKFLRKLNLGSTTTSSYYSHDLSSTNLDNLSGLESLEDLNLRYCNISGSLPASWSQLTNLKSLVVSNTALTGTIFNEIGDLTDLVTINLSQNNLTIIPGSIGNLTALESADLSYNGFDSIPATIANLTNLKTLNLRDNKLKKLPQVMESLTSLTSLNLYYNEISEIEALLST